MVAVPYPTLPNVLFFQAYVASGTFIPMMLVGAALGRLTGRIVEVAVPNFAIDSSIYAVVGSAAMMAGMYVRTFTTCVCVCTNLYVGLCQHCIFFYRNERPLYCAS